MTTRLSWDDLQFFLALARDGQLTGAARQLGTSHVTVARRIDRLEAALRQRLFERSARGYELTSAGRRLLPAAEQMEAASEAIPGDAGIAPGLGGTLRMAVPEGFSSFFSDQILPGFAARYPAIGLELITLTQVLSLSRREADLAVTLDPVTSGGYLSEKLADYHLRVYGAPALLAAHPPIRRRDDLAALPFLNYIEEMLFTPSLDYLGAVHPAIRTVFKSSSIFSQLTAARRGLGLCVLPCYMAAGIADLQPVLPEEIVLRRSYWLTCHREIRQQRRERHVIATLIDAVRRQEDRLLI